MKLRTLKAKVTQHKMKLAGLVAAVGAFIGLLFVYNFAFNPASSVHFTVYFPQGKSFASNHIVIPGYDGNSFIVFGTQQAKIGYMIFGDGTEIIQEKSMIEPSCEGIKDCVIKQTKNGQQYSYGMNIDSKQIAVLKKGDTKITIKRYLDRSLSADQWDVFIDTFKPGPVGQWYVYSDHKWGP